MLMRLCRWLFIGALAALLGACSVLSLTYNQAPTLLYWWTDSYADFDTAQSQQVKAALQRLHKWHRQAELPAYITVLEELQEKATADITPEALCQLVPTVKSAAQRAGLFLAADVNQLAQSVRPAQIKHLEQAFAKRNKDWKKEWMDAPAHKLLDKRVEKLIERSEDFYGVLSAAQQQLLKEQVLRSVFNPQRSLQETQRRQQMALQILAQIHEKKLDAAQAKVALQALFDEGLTSSQAEYRQYQDQMQTQLCQGLSRLHNSANAEQRRHLRDKLQSYAQELKALNKQAN